jgi:DNA-directed RNA polymerase subunit RPC12/RpoP
MEEVRMSIEYCFNCDRHFDTDWQIDCPTCPIEPELVFNPASFEAPIELENEEEIEVTVECPMCDHPNVPMGQLGSLMHYRCRDCGVDYNEEV